MTFPMTNAKFIRLNKLADKLAGALALLAALICHGQAEQLDLGFASSLALSTNVQVINQIPKSQLRQLPKTLQVYRYSGKPQSFSAKGLQVLLESSAFAGTNLSDLLQGTNLNLVGNSIYLKNTNRPPDIFSYNPLRGDVSVENIQRRTPIPNTDTIPTFDEIRGRLLKLSKLLGINTNELEMSNGVVKITTGDTKTSAWSGHGMERVHFISERGAAIARGINGYSSWLFDDKIVLEYGVNDRLLKFSIHWPKIEPVRTNQLLTVEEMIGQIKGNQALTDAADVTGQNITRITLKAIEIQYYNKQPVGYHGMIPLKTDIFPVAAILATFTAKDEQTEDAGIYFPILKQ